MRPIFNEKVAEKWNLWVHEQCTDALFMVEKSTFAATVQWTVAAFLQNKWKQKKKKKKKKKKKLNADADAALVNPNTAFILTWEIWLMRVLPP